MQEIFGGAAPQPAAAATDTIREATSATFVADVLEASQAVPVIVDFWAPWCGPCKQLGPVLEKLVNAQAGQVRLVKVNIDESPEIAQQLRVQSIPAVFAFIGGRPVDGFVGALPESQLKSFVDRLLRAAGSALGPSPIDEVMAHADELLATGDANGAGSLYGQVLQQQPGNAKAIAGMARCYLATGQADAAQQLIDNVPKEIEQDSEIAAVKAALELAEEADEAIRNLPALEQKLAADPADHQARFDLALALYAKGDAEAAVDHLLTIVAKNRQWNEEAARKQLVKLFASLGDSHPATLSGRQKLSSILFS